MSCGRWVRLAHALTLLRASISVPPSRSWAQDPPGSALPLGMEPQPASCLSLVGGMSCGALWTVVRARSGRESAVCGSNPHCLRLDVCPLGSLSYSGAQSALWGGEPWSGWAQVHGT